MITAGIIAEYNPFHNGHEYHIKETRQVTGADWCIVVMSGDFVQRGEPALYSKYLRAQAALSCGADLVLELPAVFAASSAEDFASCAVALLTNLGVTDYLSFGSEGGDIGQIQEAAGYLLEEPEEYRKLLKSGIRQGFTWPQARTRALRRMGSHENLQDLEDLLSSPNNLLGIEYCKAILRQRSSLQPITIRRRGSGYHEKELAGEMASASAIRQAMEQGRNHSHSPADFPAQLQAQIPKAALELYRQARPLFPQDMTLALNYALLSMSQRGEDLSRYEGMSKELADRLQRQLLFPQSWEGRIRQLKTRQYTYTRISRALVHVLMGLTSQELGQFRQAGYAPYARILGFRKNAHPLLSAIKANTSIPLVTKTADAKKRLNAQAYSMLRYDFYSSHLWQAAYQSAWGEALKNEFTQPVVIL